MVEWRFVCEINWCRVELNFANKATKRASGDQKPMLGWYVFCAAIGLLSNCGEIRVHGIKRALCFGLAKGLPLMGLIDSWVWVWLRHKCSAKSKRYIFFVVLFFLFFLNMFFYMCNILFFFNLLLKFYFLFYFLTLSFFFYFWYPLLVLICYVTRDKLI